MKRVDLYARVRYAVMIDGQSQREAARHFGIDPRTVKKMLNFSVPAGYVRVRLPIRPKLDPFTGIIEQILAEDKDRPKKQRHGIVKLTDCRLFLAFLHEAKPLKLRRAAIDNLPKFTEISE